MHTARKFMGRALVERKPGETSTTRDEPRRCTERPREGGNDGAESRWARVGFIGRGRRVRGQRRAETFARGSVSEWLGTRWGHCAKLAPWGESEPGRTTENVGTPFPTRHGFFPRARKRRRSLSFHAPIEVRTGERASLVVPEWGYDAACHGGPEILATLARNCPAFSFATRFAQEAGKYPRSPHPRARLARALRSVRSRRRAATSRKLTDNAPWPQRASPEGEGSLILPRTSTALSQRRR